MINSLVGPQSIYVYPRTLKDKSIDIAPVTRTSTTKSLQKKTKPVDSHQSDFTHLNDYLFWIIIY